MRLLEVERQIVDLFLGDLEGVDDHRMGRLELFELGLDRWKLFFGSIVGRNGLGRLGRLGRRGDLVQVAGRIVFVAQGNQCLLVCLPVGAVLAPEFVDLDAEGLDLATDLVALRGEPA